MANQGKHKKNPVLEWMEGEDGTVPTKPRGSHVVDSYIKKSKVALKKFRAAAAGTLQKVEPALLREAGPPVKAEAKHSPAASWEHQRRVERLPQLRAPYQYRSR
jgi:hypothetical protein